MYQDYKVTQAGTYTLTAKYARNAVFNGLDLGIKRIRAGSPSVKAKQALKTQGTWATGTASIAAVPGDQLQVFVLIEGRAGSSLYLDNFVLTRQ